MLLIPSIDLRDGHCVRLLKGDFAAETRYPLDAQQLLSRYRGSGHAGCTSSTRRRARRLQGNRSADRASWPRSAARSCRSAAACAIVPPSMICSPRRRARGDRQRGGRAARAGAAWMRHFGAERICLAFDVRLDARRIPRLHTHGWRTEPRCRCGSGRGIFRRRPVHVLCTDVGRDGALTGPNVALYHEALQRYPQLALAGIRRRRASAPTCRRWPSRRPGSDQRQGAARRAHSDRGAAAILAKRIIPCLDVRDGRWSRACASATTASSERSWSSPAATATKAPTSWCSTTSPPARRAVGGSLLDQTRCARTRHSVLRRRRHPHAARMPSRCSTAGAEKISVNSPALADPELIDRAQRALRVTMRGGRHRQPDGGERLPRPSIHRRRRAHAMTPSAARWTGCSRCSGAAPVRSCSIACPATECARATTSASCGPCGRSAGAAGRLRRRRRARAFPGGVPRGGRRRRARSQRISQRRSRIPELKRPLRAQGIEVRL